MSTSEELVQSFRLIVEIYRHHEATLRPYLSAGTYGSTLLRGEARSEYEQAKDTLVEYLSDIEKQGVLITAQDDKVRTAAQELIKEFDL